MAKSIILPPVFSIPFNISVSSFHLEFMLHSWRDAENEEMKNSRKKKSVHRALLNFLYLPSLKPGCGSNLRK